MPQTHSYAETPILADDVFILSEGAPNVLEGAWPDRRYYAVNRLELHLYRAASKPRARALIYPGGGYLDLVHDKEGIEVAMWLSGLGIDAYVVVHACRGPQKLVRTRYGRRILRCRTV